MIRRRAFYVTWWICLNLTMMKSFLSSVERQQIFLDICSQNFQQQLCCKRSCSRLSGDTMAHQAHILNYVFLCGLAGNLINCWNVVGSMSQLSVAPQSIPEESPSVLSPSAFSSELPPRNSRVTSQSHTFHKKPLFTALLVTHVRIMALFSCQLCFP